MPLHHGRYRDLAGAIAERLRESPQQEVIVASAGLAQAITAELLRGRAGVAGLRLQSIDAFARRLLNDAGQYPRVASDAERRMAMRAAVRTVDDPMMQTRGIAAMLERTYRDLRDGGLTLAQFQARRQRTRLALRAWSEYERLIAQLGAIDPADLLARAAALAPRANPQIVAGFYDMTAMQQRLVDACNVEAIYVPAPEPTVAPRVTQYENRIEEIRGVCARIASLLDEGVSPRDIGIVARSLDVYDIHLINRFAAERGFISTAGETIPLVAQRIGRGVAALLRLRDDDFPRAAVIELLRDGFQSKRVVRIDDVDVATRRAHVAGGASATLRHLASKPYVDDYLAVVAELEALAPAGAMSGREVAALLRKLAASFAAETENDFAAIDAIDEVAELLRRAATWRFDVAAIIDALEQQQLRPTSNGERPTIWAGDVMRFRGRSFAHLFAIRMQDDLFPQRRVEDPILPDSERREIGLREIGNGRDEERLLFQLVLDGATSAVEFSFAGSDGFGKVLRKSTFVSGLPVARCQLPVRNGQPAIGNWQRQLQLLAKSGTRSPFDGYLFAESDDASVRARLQSALQSVSPTQLEDFGECPQKFLLKHVLGARDVEDPEHELQMNARDKGKVDHGILERFYRAVTAEGAALEPSLAARVDALVDQTYDELARAMPPFNPTMREIERAATRRVLRDFVMRDLADLAANDLRPQEFEYQCEANVEGIPVKGWIDRIDTGGDGRYRVIDYKGGKATRHKDLGKKIDRGVRLQLPLYAMAVAQRFAAADVSGAIKPLVFPEVKADKFAFELREKEAAVRATIALFARSIIDGRFPAFPQDNDKDFNACKYCPVSHSCRTRHNLAEKYAVLRFEDPRTLLGGAQ
jgi:RecB family exonuclease